MDIDFFVILIFILVGVIEILLGLPLLYEKIKPNWFYGFRLPKTVNNEDIWYNINKYTAKDMIISGIVIIIGMLILLLFKSSVSLSQIVLIGTILIVITLIIFFIRGLNYLKKL